MRILEFIVPESYDGAKAHRFLRGHCKLSYRLLASQKHVEGGVTVNGSLLRTIDRIHTGDLIRITIPDDRRPAEDSDLPLDVVYEDEDVFVFNKPSGMPVHPSRGHEKDTLANACAAYLAQQGLRETFRPLNRLDRDTTGLILAARNPYAAANLGTSARKEYLAICEGTLRENGTILSPIRIKEGHGIQRETGESGESAVTHWTALAHGGGHTLLRLTLETGRTHQIRVHLSSLGHPLAGDDMYGGQTDLIPRQALHCAALRFVHPVSGKAVELAAPLPLDMQILCGQLNLWKGAEEYAVCHHPLSAGAGASEISPND